MTLQMRYAVYGSVLQCVAVCCSVLQCVAAQHSKCNRPYTNTNSHASVMPIYYTHPHITLFKIVKYKYTYMNTYTLSQDSTLVRYAALQCVAVCCSVLQCVAVCCSVLQCVALCCSVLQRVADLEQPQPTDPHPSHNSAKVRHVALQCVAVYLSVLQYVAACCSVLRRVADLEQPQPIDPHSLHSSASCCVAVCCSVLQCVAVCCSVSQCVAVCCSVLRRVAAAANRPTSVA